MFHDTGLIITLDENHGKESRKLFTQYFNENKLQKLSNFEEILNSIEMHDDKDYKLNINKPDTILSILCNADDLDAFGNIGIVRYTEIYLLRGISLNDLPKLVLQNLDNRFLNFRRTYEGFPGLFRKYKDHYLIAKRFFEDLKKEINSLEISS